MHYLVILCLKYLPYYSSVYIVRIYFMHDEYNNKISNTIPFCDNSRTDSCQSYNHNTCML